MRRRAVEEDEEVQDAQEPQEVGMDVEEELGAAAATPEVSKEERKKWVEVGVQFSQNEPLGVEVGVQFSPVEVVGVEAGVQFPEKELLEVEEVARDDNKGSASQGRDPATPGDDLNSWHDATSTHSRLPSPALATSLSLHRPPLPALEPTPLATHSRRQSPTPLTRSNLSAHSSFTSLDEPAPPPPKRAASLTASTLSSLPSSSLSSAQSSLPSSSYLSPPTLEPTPRLPSDSPPLQTFHAILSPQPFPFPSFFDRPPTLQSPFSVPFPSFSDLPLSLPSSDRPTTLPSPFPFPSPHPTFAPPHSTTSSALSSALSTCSSALSDVSSSAFSSSDLSSSDEEVGLIKPPRPCASLGGPSRNWNVVVEVVIPYRRGKKRAIVEVLSSDEEEEGSREGGWEEG